MIENLNRRGPGSYWNPSRAELLSIYLWVTLVPKTTFIESHEYLKILLILKENIFGFEIM
jgi:hypothetical protein